MNVITIKGNLVKPVELKKSNDGKYLVPTNQNLSDSSFRCTTGKRR